jgi:hypothetical protein
MSETPRVISDWPIDNTDSCFGSCSALVLLMACAVVALVALAVRIGGRR